jgi:hypothetical protein
MKWIASLALACGLALGLTGIRAAAEDLWVVSRSELGDLIRKELRPAEQVFFQGSQGRSRHNLGETRSSNDLFTFTTDDAAGLAQRLRAALVKFMEGRQLSNVRSDTGDLQSPHSTLVWSYEDPKKHVAGSVVVWFVDAQTTQFKLILVTTETQAQPPR